MQNTSINIDENPLLSADSGGTAALLSKVKDKRQKIAFYIAKNEPRQSRLINYSIISGALAAAITAGPGVGGKAFIGAVNDATSFDIPVWQLLCLVASALSMVAVILNGMLKSSTPST